MKLELNLAQIFGEYFVFFEKGKLVILLNGFAKKTQKTPKKEIEKAVRLMNDYYKEKTKRNGN